MDMVLKGQNVEYEVVLRFRPGGPSLLGVWPEGKTAEKVFTEWLGLYGRPGVVLTLTVTTDGKTRPVKGWTTEGGLRVADAAGALSEVREDRQ